MICKDKQEFMQQVCKKFPNPVFHNTVKSKIVYSGGLLVAVFNLKDNRGMII